MPAKTARPSGRVVLSRAERDGPFDPFRDNYRLADICEPFDITPRQAHRWVYEYNLLPYIQLTGKGRRFRGRDLNRFINERLVTPEDW